MSLKEQPYSPKIRACVDFLARTFDPAAVD
jgi:hypothetical protein